jgi:hypothetical protein
MYVFYVPIFVRVCARTRIYNSTVNKMTGFTLAEYSSILCRDR